MAHKVTLNWNAPAVDAAHDAPTGYNVKRAAHGSTAFATIGTTDNKTTTFTDTNVQAGDLFDYEVTAFNATGESAPCPVVAATMVPFLVPGAPSSLVAVVA